MIKFKKLILTLGIMFTITLASVIGFASFTSNNISKGGLTNNGAKDVVNDLDKTKIIYKAGDVVFQKGSNSINYTYNPSTNTKEDISTTIAYEYVFKNIMDETVAVNLKSIEVAEGVTVGYAYSYDEPLSTTNDIEGETDYTLQQLSSKGSDNSKIYIYILIAPEDTTIQTGFITNIVWYMGKPQELPIIDNITNTIVDTQIIVNGQAIDSGTLDIPTSPNGYYFDAWYLDKEYTELIEGGTKLNGINIYARFANLPSDYIAYDIDASSYYVQRGTSELPSDLIIPAIYDDGTNGKANITYIADGESNGGGVFYKKTIVSVSLPGTLTIIGKCAFQVTNSLIYINIPSGVTTIEEYAFYVSGVTNIDISSNVTTIGYGAFSGCHNLTNINVDKDNVNYSSIDGVLYNKSITNLYTYPAGKTNETFEVPLSISSIAQYAFMNAKFRQVVLNEGLKYINAYAFEGCYRLTTMTIPKTVTRISNNPFNSCSLLDLQVDEGNTSYVIDNGALYDINKTKLIHCPLNVTSFEVPSTVTTIGVYVFRDNKNLISIVIPSSVTSIEEYAFAGCTNLATVYNLSSLDIVAGATTHGYVAHYATNVYTSL